MISLANFKTQAIGLIVLLPWFAGFEVAAAEHTLIDAVKRQDSATARDLIEGDADVNEPQADGATAIHWAVHRDDLVTANLLIEAGADVNVANDFGVVPLTLAATNRSAAMTEALLKAGADANAALLTGETLLMTAAHAGDLETVDILLRHGADVDATEPVRKQTALMWALGENHPDVARTLIEHGADINAETTLGFTPLLFAAREGVLETAELLLDAGADANTIAWPRGSQTYAGGRTQKAEERKRNGLSALHVAALRGHVDLAILLLDREADPNYAGPGYAPLHWAVGSWETELDGINGMNPPEDHEWRRMAGVREGKLKLVAALLDHGANPNALLQKNPSRYGFTVTSARPRNSTPYTLAALAGEAEIMRLLVDRGADPTLKPDNGYTALMIASGLGQHRAENVAREDDLLEAAKVAVEHGVDVNATDPRGNTALHGAAWIRSAKIVQFLVDSGADVNALNKRGHSALFIADHNGRVAGPGPLIERLAVGHLLAELSVPDVVKRSLEEWGSIPRHVRNAIEALLEGELEKTKKN